MPNLLAGSSDTPLAALKRGQSFWRLQQYYSQAQGDDAPYIDLGNIVPAAIQVGPMSSIDSFRVWSVRPGAPQEAFFQDVSVGAPIVAPPFFYPSPSILTGQTDPTPPQLRIYFARTIEDLTEDFYGNIPVAPRVLREVPNVGPDFPVYLDLIVYFRDPPTIPTLRAPMNNSFLLDGQTGASQYIAGEATVPNGASGFYLWGVPGYGRRRLNFSLRTDQDVTYTLLGQNFIGGSVLSPLITRTIYSALITSANAEAQVLNTVSFDYYALNVANASGVDANMHFTFELTDN